MSLHWFMFENRRSPKHLEALTASSSSKASVMRVYDRLRDTLYCRRSICIVSSIPLVATAERILRSLHETALGSQPSAVVDSVSNLLNDVLMPAPGTSLRLTLPSGSVVCQRPGMHRLGVLLEVCCYFVSPSECWYNILTCCKIWYGIINVITNFGSV